MQPNRKIGEKQDGMSRPLGKNGCKQTNKESRGGKTPRTQEKGKATAEMGGTREGRGRMKDGERGRPIEKYGKKEQKEWLDNTVPDPHRCTAGNKEEEHIVVAPTTELAGSHGSNGFVYTVGTKGPCLLLLRIGHIRNVC